MNTPIDSIDAHLPCLAAVPAAPARPVPRGVPSRGPSAVPPAPAEPPDPGGPPPPLVRSRLGGGVLSVTLAGEFDHYSCLPLRALLDEGAALGARLLVLDAARVTFCDSALAHLLDRWARDGRTWELACGSRSVRLLLDLWERLGRVPAPPGRDGRPAAERERE
ncbi:STAS domain-containing protein [Streptomyces sp. NPDC058157]|uniref:STAS domain-containing protein n=1 Tax=Streptomyces sp. NPDC058157 TaxID=3346360 RepID=UPI0036E313FC